MVGVYAVAVNAGVEGGIDSGSLGCCGFGVDSVEAGAGVAVDTGFCGVAMDVGGVVDSGELDVACGVLIGVGGSAFGIVGVVKLGFESADGESSGEAETTEAGIGDVQVVSCGGEGSASEEPAL